MWALGPGHLSPPLSLQRLRSSQTCPYPSPRHKPHLPSPRTKVLPFEGSKKVPLNHSYSASVSSSAKWANTGIPSEVYCLNTTQSLILMVPVGVPEPTASPDLSLDTPAPQGLGEWPPLPSGFPWQGVGGGPHHLLTPPSSPGRLCLPLPH